MKAGSVSDSSDSDCPMDFDSNIVKQETYPFPINSEDVQAKDWLLVKFFYLTNKPGDFLKNIIACSG